MINKFRWGTLVFSAMPLFSCNVAIAGEWTLGGAFLVQSTPYKGVKSEDYITPLPVINYEGERVYLHTLSAGYYVWKSPQNTISLDATYSPQFFHPKENDDTAMRQLRPHRDTVMAGTTYSHLANWGTLRASIATDMLGISNGIRADGAYLYPFSGDQWELISGSGSSGTAQNKIDMNTVSLNMSLGVVALRNTNPKGVGARISNCRDNIGLLTVGRCSR